MPAITFEVSTRGAEAKLDRILPDVEIAIQAALKPIASEMQHKAQGNALAHILWEGKKPGQFVASIRGGTFRKNGKVGAYVRSGNPLAHLLEEGYTYKAQDILPRVQDVMAFYWYGIGENVMFRKVHRDQMRVRAFGDLGRAFNDILPDARDVIERAVKDAPSRPS